MTCPAVQANVVDGALQCTVPFAARYRWRAFSTAIPGGQAFGYVDLSSLKEANLVVEQGTLTVLAQPEFAMLPIELLLVDETGREGLGGGL